LFQRAVQAQFNHLLQLQESFAQTVQDSNSLNIEHERVRLQLRKTIEEERIKASVAETALLHWQQRHEATNGMLQAEQQNRQRESQAAAVERQHAAQEQWKWETSGAQMKLQLAAAVQRCEDLLQAADKQRAAASQQISDLNIAHTTEVSRMREEHAHRQEALNSRCR
jgi:hypothetical protein